MNRVPGGLRVVPAAVTMVSIAFAANPQMDRAGSRDCPGLHPMPDYHIDGHRESQSDS